MAASNRSLPAPVYGNYITILSIDGGGVKGIIPAIILEYLESLLQDKEKDEDLHIADYFDVIAGTSTGGLLTAMLTAPNPNNKSRPLFAASQTKDFYKEHGPKIFPKSHCPMSHFGEWFHPKFDGKYLHDIISKELKETRLHETLTNVVIPTYEPKHFHPTIFSSYKLKKNLILDAKLSDICIGTSAAPISLPPYYFENEVKDSSTGTTLKAEYNLVDGGVAANNPALVAISEMTQCKKENPSHFSTEENGHKKILLLSLGCGSSKHAESYEAKQSWGIEKWVCSGVLIETLNDANADMNDYYLATVFDALAPSYKYLRIQEYDLPPGISMDDGSKENLNELEKIGKELLDKNVMRMNVLTFTPEETNEGTNAMALQKLAGTLYKERQTRLLKSAQPSLKKRKTVQ